MDVAPPALAEALYEFLDGAWAHFSTPGHKRSVRFAHIIPDVSRDAPAAGATRAGVTASG